MTDSVDELELEGNVEEFGDGEYRIPEGRYLCLLEDLKKSSARNDSSKKFLKTETKLIDCLDEDHEEGVNKKVFDIFNLGSASQWKIANLAKAILPDLTGNKIPLTEMRKAKLFVANVYEDDYDPNNPQYRLKGFRSAEGWEGLRYVVNEEGELVRIGGGGKSSGEEDDESPKKSSKGKNGKKPSARASKKDEEPAKPPASSQDEEDDDDVDLAEL